MAAEPALEPQLAAKAPAANASTIRYCSPPPPAEPGTALSPVSPLLARAWAEAIMRFWEAGDVDAAQPLYLFDLAPGAGQLAWLVLRALEQDSVAIAGGLKPCYVACGDRGETLDLLAAHPYLTAYGESGRFDTALLPTAGHRSVTLRRRALPLLRTANPVVVLSLRGFGALPAELYASHQGIIMEGRLTSAPAPDGGCCQEYEWRPLDPTDSAHARNGDLFAHYLKRLTSAAFTIPTAACDMIAAFAHLSSGRYLLLAAEHGCHSEQPIRLGALMPRATWGRIAPSVNFHALAFHQQRHGALTWSHQVHDDGLVMHAACMGPGDAAFAAIIAPLSAAHPDDAARLAALASPERETDAVSLLALLKLSGHDPCVLRTALPALLGRIGALDDCSRRAWQLALSRVWANYMPSASRDGLAFDAGVLAAEVGHWDLAKTCFHAELAWYGDDPIALHHLAVCEAASGGAPYAMQLVNRALERDPSHPLCLALRDRLSERLERWRRTDWYHPNAACGDELTLEPLGREHAEAFHFQYRDVQIGVMTRLPELNTLEETRAWIDEENLESGRASFAVIHRCWGFVGAVAIHCAGDAGYFHFWIGTDFQDRGLGRLAARLLFKQAALNGVQDIFTSVYADNRRSVKALAHLGFKPLALRAGPPDGDLIFQHLDLDAATENDASAIGKRLRDLLAKTDSPIVIPDEGWCSDMAQVEIQI